jgi:hypothetical protein
LFTADRARWVFAMFDGLLSLRDGISEPVQR